MPVKVACMLRFQTKKKKSSVYAQTKKDSRDDVFALTWRIVPDSKSSPYFAWKFEKAKYVKYAVEVVNSFFSFSYL